MDIPLKYLIYHIKLKSRYWDICMSQNRCLKNRNRAISVVFAKSIRGHFLTSSSHQVYTVYTHKKNNKKNFKGDQL